MSASGDQIERLVYNTASIRISELIGRTFNNPLGEYPFDRFAALFTDVPNSRVLDIGAGRGRGAILVAKRFGAQVCAVEASAEMAAFAAHLIAHEDLQARIKVVQSDFLAAPLSPQAFEIAISFDVLSYFADKALVFEAIRRALVPGGYLLFSDYFCRNATEPTVQGLAEAWRIALPGDLAFYPRVVSRCGFRILHFEDTTQKYLSHWMEMRERCLTLRNKLSAETSLESFSLYLQSIETILSAVASGAFGHIFCVAKYV